MLRCVLRSDDLVKVIDTGYPFAISEYKKLTVIPLA
jgi:hypothetical protein